MNPDSQCGSDIITEVVPSSQCSSAHLRALHQPQPHSPAVRSHACLHRPVHTHIYTWLCICTHVCTQARALAHTDAIVGSEERLCIMAAAWGQGPQTLQASSRASRVHVCDVCEQAGRWWTWVLPSRETGPWPQAVAESPKTCLLPKATGPSLRDLGNRRSSNPRPHLCRGVAALWGWIEPEGLAGGLGPSSSVSSVLVSNPSPRSRLWAPPAGVWRAGRPRDQWLRQEKPASPELVERRLRPRK